MAHSYAEIPPEIAAMGNHQAVRAFVDGAGARAEALKGLTDRQLDAFPLPGTWSIRQKRAILESGRAERAPQ